MWTAVALAAVVSLAPDQGSGITLTNVRVTHGLLGPTRADDKLLPGDALLLAFDVEGITSDGEGKVRYSTGIEVFDPKGKSLFKQDPRDLEAIASLGGNRIPAVAQVDIGLDQPPGEHTVKVIVTDRATSKSQTLTHKFTVLPKGFGLVRLRQTSDQDGQSLVAVPGCGETLWVQFSAVEFMRDNASKQPKLTVEMRVLDAKGNPVLTKPVTGTVDKDVPENAVGIPLHLALLLNRPGKFTVELTATDQLSKKTAKATLPLTVMEVK
jgi:hypothetical protein